MKLSDEQEINGIIAREDLIKSLEQRKLYLETIIEAKERGDSLPKIDKKVANGSLKNAYNDGNLSDDLRNDVRHKTPDEIAKAPSNGRKENSLVSKVEETAVASSPLDSSMMSEASEATTATTTTTTTTSDEITTISKLDSKVCKLPFL